MFRWTLFWLFAVVLICALLRDCHTGDVADGARKGPPVWVAFLFIPGLPILAALLRQFDRKK